MRERRRSSSRQQLVEQKKPGSRPGFSFIGACPDRGLRHRPVRRHARCGVDVRRAAALRHRGRCCARGGRGRHLRACVHRRATAAARRIGLRHVGRGTLDPRRSRTPFVMAAGHDRRRLRAGAVHAAAGARPLLRSHASIRAFSRVMRACAAARSCPSRALRVAMSFSRVTRSVTPRAGPLRHTGARPFLDTGTRPLLDTDTLICTRLCLGERSVARCRRAADPGRRAVDRQPRRETLMRLPVAAPVGAAVIPGTSRIVARPVRGRARTARRERRSR